MLYIVPTSSALHFDSQARYRRVIRPAFAPDYLDYNEYYGAEIDRSAFAGEALWRYEEEQRILLQQQVEEIARRRLVESVVAAERREIARRRKQHMEMEYARAVAARRSQLEERSRREQAVKQRLGQQQLNEFQQTLLSLFLPGSVQNQQQRAPAIRRPVPSDSSLEKLGARLRGEADPEIADTLRNILQALSPAKLTAASVPAPAAARQDKGKAKEVAEPISVEIHEAPRNDRAEELAFHEFLRDFWKPVPRSGEAGPSGSPAKEQPASSEAVQPTVSSTTAQSQQSNSTATFEPAAAESEAEAAHRVRKDAMSSIQQIQNTLHTLETEFHLPATLDHYHATQDNDDTASVSSAASDMSRLIPFTANNSGVYAYENELGKLLERLDSVESNGDLEVREARREAVRGVEKALSAVESSVEQEISKNVELVQESEPVQATSSEEVVGYTVDDTASAEANVKLEASIEAEKIVDVKRLGESETDPEVREQRSIDTVYPEIDALVSASLESRPFVASDEKVYQVRVTEELLGSTGIASSTDEAQLALLQDVPVALPGVALQSEEDSSSSKYESPGTRDALENDVAASGSSVDAQDIVEEIDTFLLPASKQVSSSHDRNRVRSDIVGGDDPVIVDAEDEWSEVDA